MLDRTQIITLLGLSGFGRATVNSIVNKASFHPSNLVEMLDLLMDLKAEVPRIKIPSITQMESSNGLAKSIVEKSEKLGIKILTTEEYAFPTRLKHIPDPPVILYVKGNLECLKSELSVAIIGTREPSVYGEKCGELFAKRFSEQGILVVSGLAKGIDTTGHQGCLNAKGQTVAVLAQGLDTGIYPSENRPLAQRILDEGGCWVSEYPLGVRSRPNFFVERDRLQAGLSAGVIVIETDIKGGTMHTVGYCLEQKKPLGCLNHPEKFLIGNDKSRGNQKLINEGKATPLFTPEDINFLILVNEWSN
jgi:DNA processing protein